MSWFDTTGIAQLAKTALKEAQKQIDKALDIQDDEMATQTQTITTNLSRPKTEPSTPVTATDVTTTTSHGKKAGENLWGSFTGSFFDTNIIESDAAVTTAPSSVHKKIDEETHSLSKRESEKSLSNHISSSDSLEILSPPGSNLTSPGQHISESIEVIEYTSSSISQTGNDLSSSDSISSIENIKSPGSIEVLNEDLVDDDISVDEDSITVSEIPITILEHPGVKVSPITTAPSRSTLHLPLVGIPKPSTSPTHSNKLGDENSAAQIVDKIDNYETQSDSTQSFEEINGPYVEDDNDRAQQEPLDLESKSDDIIKVGSEQTSGHTSGDEIETTTSSDIEIISSPNCDSSSTNSAYRTSPLRIGEGKSGIDLLVVKKKGHFREPSEVSIQSNASDDSHLSTHSETEKLLRRIGELSEILEQREYKLVEMGRMNAELQNENINLAGQLENRQKRSESIELSSVADEYTQRLSALEKKFQQSIRERESLRKQYETLRLETATKINKLEYDKLLADKDVMVEELRIEGEKLSKQILTQSNIIKKIRTKEKDQESNLKRQKEQIDELTDETERLKRSLSAKEDVERSQIEAVHKLSSEKRKFEKDNLQLKSSLDDLQQKVNTIQTSFEAAKKELGDKQQSHIELSKKSQDAVLFEQENSRLKAQNQQLLEQSQQLHEKLKQSENNNNQREQNLRRENTDLMRRLEDAELRAEDNQNAISCSTIPLLKQLESLQNTLNTRTLTWEKQEKVLVTKLDDTQSKLNYFTDNEKNSKELTANLQVRIASLEEKLTSAKIKSDEYLSNIQQKQIEFNLYKTDLMGQISVLQLENSKLVDTREENKRQISELENNLRSERENLDLEKRKFDEKLRMGRNSKDLMFRQQDIGDIIERRDSSPTLSVAHSSLEESLLDNTWQMDDLESMSNSGRQFGGPGSVYGSNGFGQTTSLIENLQATLKQRDGEVHQLQWDLSRYQTERNILTTELSKLTNDLDSAKERLDKLERIETQYNDLQQKYEAILEMYGEKVEETQELKLDLLDVKKIYKSQIDELLLQKREGRL